VKITIDVPYPSNDAIRSWALKNRMGGENFGPIRWDIQMAFKAAHETALREASARFVADCADWINYKAPERISE
jgi:hypothetical protein